MIPLPSPHDREEGQKHPDLDQVGNASSPVRFCNTLCGATQGTTMPEHMGSMQTGRPLEFHDLDTFESVNGIAIWTS